MNRRSSRLSRAVFLSGLLAAAGILGACGHESEEEFDAKATVPIVVKAARKGSIQSLVSVTGLVKPAPGAELLVTAPQPARIIEIPKAEGDSVRKGDLLVRFEIPSLEAEAAGRQSDLERAQARLDNARAARERVEGLFQRGIAARKDVEDATRDLSEVEAGLSEARSAREAAGALERRTNVRALFAGIIAARWHNPGDLVEAGSGDPILRVIDPTRLQVEASVPVADLAAIEPGRRARISGPGTVDAEEATVLSRPATVDPATSTATIRLGFTAQTRLPAGTPVQVEIVAGENEGAILVPPPR